MFKVDLNKAIEWLAERWHSRYTIILSSIILVIISINFFTNVDFEGISTTEWMIIIGLVLILFLIWLSTTKLPTNKKDKIGFVISIITENKDQYKKLKYDFIDTIKEYLQKSNLKHQFNLILYPEFYAKKIDDRDSAIKYLKNSKAHFLLHGKCRDRNIKGKDRYVIDLNGAVTHAPIETRLSDIFSKEFRELLPRRISISHENDLFSFEIVSNFLNLISKYIIGIASFISGDILFAKDLFLLVLEELKNIETNLPSITNIRNRTPIRLSDMFYLLGRFSYEKYKRSKDINDLDEMYINVREAKKYKYNHYDASQLIAIYHFLKNRDVKAAINELESTKIIEDSTWEYSIAFLKAYSGELKSALKIYQKSKNNYSDITIPIQIEEFMIDIISQEPDKYQLYFCLGYINYHIKEDFASALNDFDVFINTGSPDEFIEQKKLAQQYIAIINESFKT